MKKILILTLIVLSLGFNTRYVNANGDLKYIDVKIGKEIGYNEVIKLYSEDGFYLYDKNRKDDYILRIDEKEIHIIGKDSSKSEIYDISGNLIDSFKSDGNYIIGSQDTYNSIIRLDKNRYRDYICFLVKGNKTIMLNHIELDKYLFGVVPKEIPASSHIDALRAQSVVARSYTYINFNKHMLDGYNLCDTTHCQVYGGFEWEHPSTNQAVIDTFGEYVAYDGKVVDTPYHSNSGGHTEASDKVWGGKLPYLTAIKDIYSLDSPNSNWTIKLSAKELEEKLSNNGINIGEIKDIEVLQTTSSSRVEKLKIAGSISEEIISGEKLRSIVGASNLKSTLFNIGKEGTTSNQKIYLLGGSNSTPVAKDLSGIFLVDGNNKKTVNRNTVSRAKSNDDVANLSGTVSTKTATFVFEGKGYGHGVGMSQYGAMEMAKLGHDYKEIIKHYYKGVEIINLGK